MWFGCFSQHIYTIFFTKTDNLKYVYINGTLLLFQMFQNALPLHKWHVYYIHVRIFNDTLDDALNTSQFTWIVIEAKNWTENLSQYDFVKCSYYFWTFLWFSRHFFSIFIAWIKFIIHSIFTNIFNLRYNWEKTHKNPTKCIFTKFVKCFMFILTLHVSISGNVFGWLKK